MVTSLVPIFANRELVVLFASDPNMSGRSIQLFRHLERQNLSIISYSIGRVRWFNNSRGRREARAGAEYSSMYTGYDCMVFYGITHHFFQ